MKIFKGLIVDGPRVTRLKEIDSIEVCEKDHFHFTNDCCLCRSYCDDSEMKPIKIKRNNYYELDYACQICLKDAGKL